MNQDQLQSLLSNAKRRRRYRNRPARSTQRDRRGAAMIVGVIMMGVLVSMLAFAIDIGYIAVSKAEARRTADAAALAGCWKVYDGAVNNMNAASLENEVLNAASSIALSNPVCNAGPVLSLNQQNADFELGYMASLSGTTQLFPIVRTLFVRCACESKNRKESTAKFRFTSRESLAKQEETYRRINRCDGDQDQRLLHTEWASTTRLICFPLHSIKRPGMLCWPVAEAISIDSTRNATKSLRALMDSRSQSLPPRYGSPGNRGTVDIGGANNSTADIARQIVHGISADDLIELGKPLVLANDGKMTLNGDTGISAGVKDELASIIGQTRIIPIFQSVSETVTTRCTRSFAGLESAFSQ